MSFFSCGISFTPSIPYCQVYKSLTLQIFHHRNEVGFILSIDLGSSGIRACLVPMQPNSGVIWVSNDGNEKNRYTWPANGCIFGDVADEDIYKEWLAPDQAREEVALKYGFYILADAPADMTAEYPMFRDLLEEDRINRDTFRHRVTVGISSMLRVIRQKAETQLTLECRPGWVIKKITASIPSQWTLDFEVLYRNFLRQAFQWSEAAARTQIRFYYEIQGIANLLLKTRGALINNAAHGDQLVLLLDFGGHSMVSNEITVFLVTVD